MKNPLLFISVFLIVTSSGCNFIVDSSKKKADSVLATSLQDSSMVRAASNYANFCASCHRDDMGWFRGRKWKYGTDQEAIYKSIETGYSDFGMLGYADTLSKEEMNDLAKFIALKLEIKENITFEPGAGIYKTEELKLRPDTVIKGLNVPWGLAFLPDGDMIVNEREGKMLRYRNGVLAAEIKGLPEIHAEGQGGLMDIRLHPDYKTNGWIYFSYTGLPKKGRRDGILQL